MGSAIRKQTTGSARPKKKKIVFHSFSFNEQTGCYISQLWNCVAGRTGRGLVPLTGNKWQRRGLERKKGFHPA
jgi:hypothetical protein